MGSNSTKWSEGHFDHLYIGETANNPRIDIYTENETTSIADTFTDTTTDKSYIYFQAGTSSNDPAYIMHETSNATSPDERNEGVLHLVPTDDNGYGDYVSIHGTNDPDVLKLHTDGTIETGSSYQLKLVSGSGIVRIDDGLEVIEYISHVGDSDTYVRFEENRIRIAAGGTVKFDTNNTYLTTVAFSDLTGKPSTLSGYGINDAVSLGADNVFTGDNEFEGDLLRTNQRINNNQEYPLGHYTPGETVFELNPTWSNRELRQYFANSNVSWDEVANAPGGYAVYINGSVQVGGDYNSGFPYIPIDQDGIYYMECWIKNAGSGQTHYMGSIDYEADFTNPASGAGNPGSYGYWTMSNTNPGSSWVKKSGYITGHHNSNTGAFETDATYWTPQALFNYGAGTGTRACWISGWKVIRVDHVGDRTFQDDVFVKGKLEVHTLDSNTSSTTALVMNGNEVEKRTLGSNAFNSTAYITSSGSITGNAATATIASKLASNGNISTQPGTNNLLYTGQINAGTTGLFSASDNSNSIITLNRHSGNYDSQLGFSSNGNIYYRKFSNSTAFTTQAWNQVWHSGNFANNSSNWNTAYGWGNHASAGYASASTTLSGYGITDAVSLGTDNNFTGANTFTGSIGNSTTIVPSVRVGLSSGNDPQIQFTDSGYNAHIDFGASSGDDFDVRIIHSAANTLDIQGAGNSGFKVNNNVVWNSGNDGASSGLDADLLDGNHASAFATSAQGTKADNALPKAGGTVTGGLTIDYAAGTNPLLSLFNDSNGNGAKINFSDQSTPSQNGTLMYVHSDGNSYGTGNAFVFSGTETTMNVVALGNLMYRDGIYKTPSSGTGAGTRKDANWDTAYGWGNHASAGYLTTHPSISAASSVNNSGRTYIQDITLDSNGHITAITSATETVVNTNTQLSDAQVRSKFSAGSNVSISAAGAISASNTDTVTSVGVSGSETTGTITLTSAGATTLTQSGQTVEIRSTDTQYTLPVAGSSIGGVKSGTDISVDSSGNVSVNNDSHTHDGRYYTETESDSRFFRRYTGQATNISNTAYRTAFTVAGGNLASSIRFSAQGTTGSVVVSNVIDVIANHYQDILIEATSGVYTRLYVKVVSNNNEDFAVELKTNHANAVTLDIEVLAYGNETVTFTTSHSFTGASLELDCEPGKTFKATGGDNGDLRVYGTLNASGYNDSNWNTAYGWGNHASAGYSTASGVANNANNYSLPAGSSSVRGGFKIGYTESGKNYPVEVSSEKMFVNVPWTDSNTNYYLNGITKSGNTLTFAISGATNQTYTFGSNAFNSTTYSTASGVEDNADVTDTANVVAALTAGTNVQIAANGTISATDTDTVYTHPTSAGNKHIPTGGAAGQFLKYSSSGTATWATPSYTTNTNTQLSNEQVQDIVGAMFSGNTETNITATYQDGDGTIDLSVAANYGSWDLVAEDDTTFRVDTTEHVKFQGASISGTGTSADPFLVNTADTNTTYTADGNYGMTLNGTAFRLENDRRRNSSTQDIYTGNTHDYTFYDADVGIRWYTAAAEEMRLENDGDLHVDGDVIAFSTTVSDERLKDDIQTIENATEKVSKLRGVSYTWNDGSRKGEREIGVIAQEVEQVVPEIVHEKKLPFVGDETYKTVDYEKLVALLIESNKEQQDVISQLEERIIDLENRL